MDKNRPHSKYECLAKLISTSKPFDSYSLLKLKPAPLPSHDAHKQAESAPAAKSEQTDNNNKSSTEHAAAKAVQASQRSPTTESPQESEVIQLKIVEKEPTGGGSGAKREPSQSDNDEDNSTTASNSSNSFDSNEKSETNGSHECQSENNNECPGAAEECVAPEEPTAVDDAVSNRKVDCVDKGEKAHGDASTTFPLDINENKSEIRLKYAEVVKMDSAIDLCENTNFDPLNDPQPSDEPAPPESTKSKEQELDPSNDSSSDEPKSATAESVSENKVVSSPKPIHASSHRRDEQEEMSPICKIRLPLNSPRLVKTKDMMSELPLTPDSTHSLDSSCEFPPPFDIKPYSATIAPERSFSSESLNSETSIESNDSKSSIKLTAAKFSKNGTLERQSNSGAANHLPATNPGGLQVLMLWNNNISRDSAHPISDLLGATSTLEILNVGKNVLSNDFVANIKTSLKSNTSLTSLGLQSAHLSNDGIKTLSEILDFGGNVTLQRVDLRDNNLQVSGLGALNEVLKSNKSITRIDLDDVPRRTVSSRRTAPHLPPNS